jgi:two-component sensor histidine kinase
MTERLSLLALTHEQLGELDGEPGTGFCGYLESLAEAVHAAIGNSNVRLEVVCEPVVLSAKRASAVGAIIDELLTAALTQRFPEQRCGTVQVESRPLSDRRIELSISDDGLNETLAQQRARGSFRRQLVERMIAHANGTIRYELDGGTRCVITLNPD